MAREAPERIQRDRVVWLVYLVLAYFGFVETSIGPLMPKLREELGLSYTVAGLHFVALSLGQIINGIWGDRVARRFGRNRMLQAAFLMHLVVVILFMASPLVSATITLALSLGILTGVAMLVLQATLPDCPPDQRVVLIAEFNVAFSLSAAAASLAIGGAERIGIGWRGAFAALLLVTALAAIPLRRIRLPDRVPYRAGTQRVSKYPLAFRLVLVIAALGTSVEWCLAFGGASFLAGRAAMTHAGAATAMSAFFVAMILGRLVGSRIARRYEPEAILLAAMVIALVGFPLAWLATSSPFNLVGLAIVGLGIANIYPFAFAVSSMPGQADVVSARIGLATGISILLAPLLLASLADRIGIVWAFGVSLPLMGVGLGLVVLLRHQAALATAPG